MTRRSTHIATALTAAFIMAGAAVPAAHATYLGYGNGDPGNWDLWTEQAGGPAQFKAEEARERQWEQRHSMHVQEGRTEHGHTHMHKHQTPSGSKSSY
ncbi:hypothetical protein [Hyphomicrobium sp.]|uniref:hypothetical protein n=1 Tax=Hyphomicrobium sp. TaxID=82 RepID=UPI003F7150F4